MSIFPAVRPAVSPAVRGAFEQSYGGGAASIIASLFAAGQQGFWLPFTDFASLSQDSAGTLPYTALEQPVGRVLDRSGRGNHASQPTSTARGVVSARVNALLNTDNPAAWGYAGSVFSVGAKEADGGWPLTALSNNATALAAVNTDYPIGSGAVTNATIVRSIELQAGTASFVRFGAASGTDAVTVDLVTKAIVYNSGALPVTIVPLADNWVRVEFWSSRASFSASLLSNYLSWGLSQSGGAIGATGQIGSTIKVRNPSYSRQALGYTAPVPFQRVGATPTDYDSVGFPKYLRLDGTDDYYTCGGGGSTTGFYYSDVVRPTSSATTVLFSDIGTNSGYELVIMNTGVLKLFFGNGTGFSSVEIGGVLIPALTHVAVWDDASNIYLQINGGTPVTVARGVFVAGTANYCTLYRTNSVSAYFFNGQTTEPIYRAGPPPSAYERGVIRTYQMQKAGML